MGRTLIQSVLLQWGRKGWGRDSATQIYGGFQVFSILIRTGWMKASGFSSFQVRKMPQFQDARGFKLHKLCSSVCKLSRKSSHHVNHLSSLFKSVYEWALSIWSSIICFWVKLAYVAEGAIWEEAFPLMPGRRGNPASKKVPVICGWGKGFRKQGYF